VIELDRLSGWFKANKLSNVEKTKFILFHPQNRALMDLQPQVIVMEGKQIEQVSEQKFLGVYIDQFCNWKCHVNSKNNQLSKNIGVLSRLKHIVPSDTLKILYHAIILPHLSYGAIAWGETCNKELKRMITLQKRAIRVINKIKYNAHTNPLFKKSKILTVHDIYKVQCCKIVYKMKHNMLPPTISDLISTANETHSYSTRQALNIRPQRTVNSISKQLLSIKLAKTWNSLPDSLKSHTNLSLMSFTNHLKEYLISQYKTVCTSQNNCYICKNNQ
jgi:hypothetical protein